jgi:hypothetical protein
MSAGIHKAPIRLITVTVNISVLTGMQLREIKQDLISGVFPSTPELA